MTAIKAKQLNISHLSKQFSVAFVSCNLKNSSNMFLGLAKEVCERSHCAANDVSAGPGGYISPSK